MESIKLCPDTRHIDSEKLLVSAVEPFSKNTQPLTCSCNHCIFVAGWIHFLIYGKHPTPIGWWQGNGNAIKHWVYISLFGDGHVAWTNLTMSFIWRCVTNRIDHCEIIDDILTFHLITEGRLLMKPLTIICRHKKLQMLESWGEKMCWKNSTGQNAPVHGIDRWCFGWDFSSD